MCTYRERNKLSRLPGGSSRATSIVCSQARSTPGLKEQDERQSPKPSDKKTRRLTSCCCFKPMSKFQALTAKERGHGHTPGPRGDAWSLHYGVKACEGRGCLFPPIGSSTKCLISEKGEKKPHTKYQISSHLVNQKSETVFKA